MSPERNAFSIQGGEVYAPEYLGNLPVLTRGRRILGLDGDGAEAEAQVLDATGCFVVPAPIALDETVGRPGAREHAARLFREGFCAVMAAPGGARTVKDQRVFAAALRAEGIGTHLYTDCCSGTARHDVLFVDEVIGVACPALRNGIAHVVRDAAIAARLTGKAGVARLDLEGRQRAIQAVLNLIDEADIDPEMLCLHGAETSDALLEQAVDLTRSCATLHIDAARASLPHVLRRYLALGADPSRITVSCGTGSLVRQLVECVHAGLPGQLVFRLASTNAARVLKLRHKGSIATGGDANVLAIDRGTGSVRHLIVNGVARVLYGRLTTAGRPQEALRMLPALNSPAGVSLRAATR